MWLTNRIWAWIVALILAATLQPPAWGDEPAVNPLKSVKNFMCQLDDLDDAGAVDRLARSGYDMLIVEPTFNIKGNENFDARAMVKSLHDGKPGRIVLAYLSIGEAESNRDYWHDDWHLASAGAAAHPGYLLGPDPDGDATSFLVRYWRSNWRHVLTGDNGVVSKIMNAGFDGVFLDSVDAGDNEKVDDAAAKDKVDPDKAMVDLISAIRSRARALKPDSLVVVQNAAFLVESQAKFPSVIDGIVFEDTWFSGNGEADWDSPDAGDIPNKDAGDDSTGGLIRQYEKYLHAGLPVFTIDYCVNPENAARVYRESAGAGFVPLVTRASEDDMTPSPPPNLPLAVMPPNLPAKQP